MVGNLERCVTLSFAVGQVRHITQESTELRHHAKLLQINRHARLVQIILHLAQITHFTFISIVLEKLPVKVETILISDRA